MAKEKYLIFALFLFVLIVSLTNISALSCDTWNPCPGTVWHRGDTSKIIERYACIDNQCNLETKEVECTTNDNCGTNERCDTNTWKCVLSSNVAPGDENNNINESTVKTNYLTEALIIGIAVIIGFIILAIVLKKRK